MTGRQEEAAEQITLCVALALLFDSQETYLQGKRKLKEKKDARLVGLGECPGGGGGVTKGSTGQESPPGHGATHGGCPQSAPARARRGLWGTEPPGFGGTPSAERPGAASGERRGTKVPACPPETRG